jgi:hypothetical protein
MEFQLLNSNFDRKTKKSNNSLSEYIPKKTKK